MPTTKRNARQAPRWGRLAKQDRQGTLPRTLVPRNLPARLGGAKGRSKATTIQAKQFLYTPRYTTGSQPISIAAGDFNGDGHWDLATANSEDYTVSVLLGNGDGTFQGHVDYATGGHPRSVAVGDFNEDGRLDLVTGNIEDNENNTVSVLLGNGDGTFRTYVDYLTGGAPPPPTCRSP